MMRFWISLLCSIPLLPLAAFAQKPAPVAKGDYDFAAMIQPPPDTARFSNPDYNIWCGSMVRGDDGKYHLFYSRWPRKLGHGAWVSHSEVAHAVADRPLGPYKHVDVSLPARGRDYWDGSCTHNPTVLRAGGKYYLYYMGNRGDEALTRGLNWTHRNNQRVGVAVADNPNGPWQRFDKPLIEPTPGSLDALCCTNPTVTTRPGGGFLMIYKGVADRKPLPFGGPVVHIVATSDSPTGPFTKHPQPVFSVEGVNFAAEDPFIWWGKDRYWAVLKDCNGHFTGRGYSVALFESTNGFDWKQASHPLVTTPGIRLPGGGWKKFSAMERPQVWLDETGEPAVLFCAGAETPDRDGSFNVQIPLK